MAELTIIFGASNFGKIVYEKIKDSHNVLGFCDNDPRKWGANLFEKQIYSAKELLDIVVEREIRIIIASSFYIDILNQLSSMGISFVDIAFIQIKHDPFEREAQNEIVIKGYNIEGFSDIKIIENKIGLIVRSHSGSNTLALWRNTPKNIREKFDVVLIDENQDKMEYFKEISKCKVLVTTHSNNIRFLEDNRRVYIQLWHGFPLKAVGKLDKSIPDVNRVNKKNWNLYTKIASYSEMFTSIISGCFGGINSNYEITGAPRNDNLFNSLGKENLETIINGKIGNKKIILYAPTFRHNKYHQYLSGNKDWKSVFGFNTFNFEEFSKFLNDNGILLLLKMHPYEEQFVSDVMKKHKNSNIYLLLDSDFVEIDFYEIINAIDLMITDYSSIFYDYLLLDRPIIFTPIDLEEYKSNTGMLYGPYDFWTPGDKALCQEQLQEYIKENLKNKNKYKNERERIRRIIHQYVDNYSTARVWKMIEGLLNEQTED